MHKTKPHNVPTDIRLLSPDDCMACNLAKTTTYELFHSGEIETIKIGRRVYVTEATFREWLAKHTQVASHD